MTIRAPANGSVRVWFSHLVTARTSPLGGGRPLQEGQRVGGTFYRPLVILLGKGDLFRRKISVTRNGGPSRRRMTAAQELLVLRRVAFGTVLGRQVLRNDKALVIQALLAFLDLVAIEAIDSPSGMSAGFILVNDRRGFPAMALGAFSRGLDQTRRRLLDFHRGSIAVDQHRADNNSGSEKHRDEYRLERDPVHSLPSTLLIEPSGLPRQSWESTCSD